MDSVTCYPTGTQSFGEREDLSIDSSTGIKRPGGEVGEAEEAGEAEGRFQMATMLVFFAQDRLPVLVLIWKLGN